MSASSTHRDLALWILRHEINVQGERDGPGIAAEHVCRKFYARLAPLVTTAGSQAFLTRSLHLARAEFPFLDGVRAGPNADLCLDGIDDAMRGVEPAVALDAFVTVIANMIGLLVTFIGQDLAVHTIRDGWPDADTGPVGGEEKA